MRRSRLSVAVGVSLATALCVPACGGTDGTGPGGSLGASGGSKGAGGSSTGSSGSTGASGSGGANGSSGSSGTSGSSGSGGSGTYYPPGTAPGIPFAGANGSGQNTLITAGISPQSCGNSPAFNGTTVKPVSGDNLTCYFSGAVSPTTPLAFIEQDEELIGSKDLIHVRLTLNPAFVDNTYGTTAIGWGGTDAGTMMMGPGAHGHSFWDLVDSDHAEFDFKNASGDIVLSFNEDYCSSDANAPSGFACLGVAGGDGGMLVGSASSIVYYDSSFSRDLNACGYGSYTTNSPATDANYTPNPATPDWDYRVVYDVWVLKSVLPSGWTVSIPYVHASPSKMASTYTVTSAPCPPLGCAGEGCSGGGTCAGSSCEAGTPPFGSCTGEGCADAGQCVGLLCDGGSPVQCVGELCNGGGGLAGDGGGNWCSQDGAVCTASAACCSGLCSQGYCGVISR
jgi:hypothetical protein